MSNNLYLYQSKLSGSNSVSGNFGLRSAISDNGDTILVGSYRDSNSNNIYDGSVYYSNKIDNIFYLNLDSIFSSKFCLPLNYYFVLSNYDNMFCLPFLKLYFNNLLFNWKSI